MDEHSLDPKVAVQAFVNVNDKTNEGLKYVGKNILPFSTTRKHARDRRIPDICLTAFYA